MLNGFALNEEVLNGAPGLPSGLGQILGIEQIVEPPPSGEGQILGIEQEVAENEPSFAVLLIEQTIAMFSDGVEELLGIEQIVSFREVGEGKLFEIEQTVQSRGVGQILAIEQRVQSSGDVAGVVRRGWEAFVTLNGQAIECLHAQIQVTRTESGAALMTVTNIPSLGIQDIDNLAGKPITCDIQIPAGLFRIFTGKVDVPHINLIEKKITLNCTDNRIELINTTMASAVPSIGYWSPVIFSTPKDAAEELDQRLTTVHMSVDFDPYGVFSVTSKQVKVTPDFILTGIPPDGVYYRDPSIEYTSRANITNRITITFQYRFARLYHMEKVFSWTSPIASNLCLFLQQGYTFAARSMIEQAVLSSGWPVRGEISYAGIQPSGWYNCPAFGGGISGAIAWSTTSFTRGAATPVRDPDTGLIRKDANGNPVMETLTRKVTDYSQTFANGAQWRGTTRWVQTVIENYSLVVSAPQSIAQYGAVDAANQYSSQDTTDTSSWENYKTYNDPYGHPEIPANYFVDTATTRSALNGGITTAVNIAKTTILNLHRDTRVSINRFIWPQVDLKHTVEVNATITNGGALRARGKVFNIVHTLDCGTGEGVSNITLALSRAQGSQVDTPVNIPVFGLDTIDFGSPTVALGNHYGEDPTNHPEWNGRIGNKYIFTPGFFPTLSSYPEQFIVDTPAIPDALRADREKSIAANYLIGLPNNLLEITF
jgi:hypothetical protein